MNRARTVRTVGLSIALLAAGCGDDSAPATPLGATGGSAGPTGEAGSGQAGAAGAMSAVAGSAGNTADPSGSGEGGTAPVGLDGTSASGAAGGAATPSDPDAAPPDEAPDAGEPVPPDEEPTFSPCPGDGSPCIVMPFGDSITEGFPVFNGGYRVELFRQANRGGHSITFVGDRSNGPPDVDGVPFPPNHDGFSGFTIDPSSRSGISPLAEPAIAAYGPHIILLMIGTNDIDQNIDVAGAPARLGALIDRITTADPDLLLVVATVIPTTNAATNPRIVAFDAAIPALVQARQAAGKHVVGVDMFAAFAANLNFNTELMVDALHPNDAGYALLGQRFYQTIEPFLAP